MQTSLYKISLKDGRVFKVFCANRKQNKDMLFIITQLQCQHKIKRNGLLVVEHGIHNMNQFKSIINNLE